MVLGPSTPPVLAVQVLRWLTDPDPAWRPVGAAGALLQLGLIAVALAAWRMRRDALVARLPRPWLVGGPSPALERVLWRRRPPRGLRRVRPRPRRPGGRWPCGRWPAAWRFPAALPQTWSLASWALGRQRPGSADRHHARGRRHCRRWSRWRPCSPAWSTRRAPAPKPETRVLALAYLPLLVPQISFLFGLQVLFVRLGLDATLIGLVWSHLVFVLPYVVLMLRGPYLALDPR